MTEIREVFVPDIGDFKVVPVIEIAVKPGDAIAVEDPLITLESDKAAIDVPAPASGTVKDVKLKLGDKVSAGTLMLLLETNRSGEPKGVQREEPRPVVAAAAPASPPLTSPLAWLAASVISAASAEGSARPTQSRTVPVSFAKAGPSVRKFARELPHRVRRGHPERVAGDSQCGPERHRRHRSRVAELAKLAREGKLKPDQMRGGCFSISSLGGIGGTFFTPIINAPEVAILGVCESRALWMARSVIALEQPNG